MTLKDAFKSCGWLLIFFWMCNNLELRTLSVFGGVLRGGRLFGPLFDELRGNFCETMTGLTGADLRLGFGALSLSSTPSGGAHSSSESSGRQLISHQSCDVSPS